MANDGKVDQLQMLQNKALRIVFQKNRRENIQYLYKVINSFTVQQLTTFTIIRFMYDFVNKKLPAIFQDLRAQNIDVRNSLNLRLRNNNELNEPCPKFLSILKLPLLNFPRLWNNSPNELKNIKSRYKFSIELKRSIIQ